MPIATCAILGLLAQLDPHAASTDNHSSRGLVEQTMLHPVDGFTADTLAAGELIYHQPAGALPLPGWWMVGLTDWLTVNVDLVSILGGLVIEPHYPIVAVNARFRLAEQSGAAPALALETMVHHLWGPFDDQLDPANPVRIDRDGTTVFARVNASWRLSHSLRLHLSAGATWNEYVRIENQNRETEMGRTVSKEVNPDASLAVDWRPLPWLSLHLSTSYGSTFVYLDLVPRKVEIAFGPRLAPFCSSKRAVLRTLRIEAAVFAMYFHDAREWLVLPVPVFPVAYWQW